MVAPYKKWFLMIQKPSWHIKAILSLLKKERPSILERLALCSFLQFMANAMNLSISKNAQAGIIQKKQWHILE